MTTVAEWQPLHHRSHVRQVLRSVALEHRVLWPPHCRRTSAICVGPAIVALNVHLRTPLRVLCSRPPSRNAAAASSRRCTAAGLGWRVGSVQARSAPAPEHYPMSGGSMDQITSKRPTFARKQPSTLDFQSVKLAQTKLMQLDVLVLMPNACMHASALSLRRDYHARFKSNSLGQMLPIGAGSVAVTKI